MTKREKKIVATMIAIAICFLAVFCGYKATKKNDQKASETKKSVVTADFSQLKRQQVVPQPSTAMAEKAPKSPVVVAPVAPVVDSVDMTQVMSTEELAENTTVVNGGEEADNKDADSSVPKDYKDASEKEDDRNKEKEQIEKEEGEKPSIKDDEVINVPQDEEDNKEIEDLVDENGDVVDDTDVAVEDYEPEADSVICDQDTADHNHVVVVTGGFRYVFCEKTEEIKVEGESKFMPWETFGYETEAAYVAELQATLKALIAEAEAYGIDVSAAKAVVTGNDIEALNNAIDALRTSVEAAKAAAAEAAAIAEAEAEAEEAEKVESVDVDVDAEENKNDTCATEETADACETVEDDAIEFYAEEVVEAEKVEDDVILSVVDCNN